MVNITKIFDDNWDEYVLAVKTGKLAEFVVTHFGEYMTPKFQIIGHDNVDKNELSCTILFT